MALRRLSGFLKSVPWKQARAQPVPNGGTAARESCRYVGWMYAPYARRWARSCSPAWQFVEPARNRREHLLWRAVGDVAVGVGKPVAVIAASSMSFCQAYAGVPPNSQDSEAARDLLW